MKKSVETKKLLLATVKDLLSRTADIKVKDIADTAFVNIAAVNYHFDDKDKLVELAMNEIFVDFKYELNSFDPSEFSSRETATTGFVGLIFEFVKSHIGFFRRIAQMGSQGTQYFHEDEFVSISTRQLLALGLNKSSREISAVFASVLAQIVFAVLYFPKELEEDGDVKFMNTYFTGVAGGTGSGKTTVSKKLFDAFENDAVMISHDYYYKNNTHLSFEERVKQNYDHPNALDTHILVEHLKDLKAGKSIDCPQYSFDRHIRTDEVLKLSPAKIVIVDGILIFENEELRELCDIKIFVDTDADVRFIRRLKRDVKKRGRSMESVITQYLTTVKIMHDQFVEPSKKFADIIVPEGGKNMVAVNMLIDGIRKKLD